MILSKKVAQALGRKIGFFLLKYRRQINASVLSDFISSFSYYYNNRFYHFEGNGEANVLKRLCSTDLKVIFDVGAHHGEYIKQILKYFPNADIHAFEINSINFKQLAKVFQEKPKITLNEIGLGSKSETLELTQYNEAGDISSLHPMDIENSSIIGRSKACVLRGDEYLQKNNIEKVHFMKIDTEGNDLAVLKGFGDKMNSETFDVVQFEYNESSIFARVFLKDFYSFLRPLGFTIGQIFPTGVDFKEYNSLDEMHRGSNWIACSNRTELQAKLSDLTC